MARRKNINYDLDSDGKLSREEIELENADKKSDLQRKMAVLAMLATFVVTLLLMLPIYSEDRLTALSDLIGLFYISMAGVIASFFGAEAYMSANK